MQRGERGDEQQIDEALRDVRAEPHQRLRLEEQLRGPRDERVYLATLRVAGAEHVRLFRHPIGLSHPGRVADLSFRQRAGAAPAGPPEGPQSAEQSQGHQEDEGRGHDVQNERGSQESEERERRADQRRHLQGGACRLHRLTGQRLLHLALAVLRLDTPGGMGEGIEQPRANPGLHVGGDSRRQDRDRKLQQQADGGEAEGQGDEGSNRGVRTEERVEGAGPVADPLGPHDIGRHQRDQREGPRFRDSAQRRREHQRDHGAAPPADQLIHPRPRRSSGRRLRSYVLLMLIQPRTFRQVAPARAAEQGGGVTPKLHGPAGLPAVVE